MSIETLQVIDSEAPVIHDEHQSLELFDALGIVASAICMVHCLALPVIFAVLPMTSKWLGQDNVHYLLAGWVLLFCLAAIVPGYLKHRQLNILICMLAGLSLVLAATFGLSFGISESLEVPMITVGNLLVIAAHWRNRSLSHAHVNCRH
ncbi:MAG: MerC domain-containing protein [Cyanobacteria bacterium SZAS LIN-2]|nr:MerC domain-containing protein [Cyanobacteria bacterium SZAS LIN-2]